MSRAVQRAPLLCWVLRRNQFAFLARLVLYDVPCHGARGHGQRAAQIHLTRTAAAGEVAVLRADDDLVSSRRDSGAGIDAGSATGLNDVRARLLEHFQVPALDAILPRFLRTAIDVKLHRSGNALSSV